MDKPLTVAELIAQLQELPQELPVHFYSYDDYQDFPVMWMPVTEIEMGRDDGNIIVMVS